MPGEFFTERLRARPATPGDLGLIAELNSDVDVMRHLTGRAMTIDESAADLAAAIAMRWLLFVRDDRFVGWVGAVPLAAAAFDLGWRLRRSAWGQGYASEAASTLVDLLFEAGAARVIATTMAVNVRSRAVMDRVGLTHVRTFQLEFDDPLPGTDQGEVEYELMRQTWLDRRTG